MSVRKEKGKPFPTCDFAVSCGSNFKVETCFSEESSQLA